MAAECRLVLATTSPRSTAIEEAVSLVEKLYTSILSVLNEETWSGVGKEGDASEEASERIDPWLLFQHGEALLSCLQQMAMERADFVLVHEAFYRRLNSLLVVLFVSLHLRRGNYRGIMKLMEAYPNSKSNWRHHGAYGGRSRHV